MNWTQILRIAWKDYRRIGGLWFIFVGFWLLCLCYLTAVAFYTRNFVAPMTVEQTMLAALSTAMIYALAWAGLTFSAEHEDGTYGFLRGLPLHAKQVFYGKLFFGVNSTILLILMLGAISCLHAFVLAGRGGRYAWGTGDSSLEVFGAGMMGITIPLVMAVGLFCSLRIRRPLLALALTGITAVLVTYACVGAGALLAQTMGDVEEVSDVTYGTLLLGLAAAVLLIVDRYLVVRWLPNYSILDAPARPVLVTSSRAGSSFGRLFWLHRRQTLSTCIILGASGALLTRTAISPYPWPAAAVAALFSGMLGIIAFYHDHRESRYRQLAQLAVRPIEYWASRLLMPGIATAMIVVLSLWHKIDSFGPSGNDNWQLAMPIICYPLAVFSIAQFFSLAYFSIVLSIAATLISSIIACFWIVFCLKLRVPAWLTWLPMMLLPFMASYLRVSWWFRDTGSWRQWVVPAIPLLLLIFGVPVATAIYRIYEVPNVEMPPALTIVPPKPTPEEEAGALAYRAVFADIPRNVEARSYLDATGEQDPELVAWTENNRDVVEHLVTATQVATTFPEEYRHTTWQPTYDLDTGMTSAAILLISGQQAAEQNDVDGAWEYFKAALNLARHQNDRFAGTAAALQAFSIERAVYRELVPWAMMPENAPEKIASVAEFVDDFRLSQPPWTDPLRADYRYAIALLDEPMQIHAAPWARQVAGAVQFLPWEIVRARRLIEYAYAQEFRNLQQAEAGEIDLDQIWRPTGHAQLVELTSTTAFGFLGVGSMWPSFVHAEHVRRGTIYQLAAILYRRRKSAYPADFSHVTLGNRRLPDDVFVPGFKLKLDNSIETEEIGLHIRSARAGNEWTYSDGHYEKTHFLLPDFGDWNAERFRSRFRSTTVEGRKTAPFHGHPGNNDQTLTTANPDEQLDLLSLISSGGGFGGSFAGGSPEAYSAIATILQNAIRDTLKTGEEKMQIEVLGELRTVPEMIPVFLSEIAPLLQSDSLALVVRAAQVLRTAIISGNLHAKNLDAADELFSKPRFGVPIKNPSNGHYYEVVREAATWEAANQAAMQRTYRGMQGHLVTITSADEEQFLSRAFVDLIAESSSNQWSFEEDSLPFSAWTGGSDRDEVGVWRWVCGPEAGEVFWRQGDEAQAAGFANWMSSEPSQEAGKDYLLWESNFDGENSQQARWRSVDRDAIEAATPAAYFVEYSPTAE